MQQRLRFGDLEGKAMAMAFNRRAKGRDRVQRNVEHYYRTYVKPEDWPTINAPACFFPKSFRRVPLSVLHAAAVELQKNTVLTRL